MSTLRPELVRTNGPALSYENAYYRVLQSVAQRRSLIHGHLENRHGTCALGAYFKESNIALPMVVIDEIAAYNDSFPALSNSARWRNVNAWLKFRIDVMRRKKP